MRLLANFGTFSIILVETTNQMTIEDTVLLWDLGALVLQKYYLHNFLASLDELSLIQVDGSDFRLLEKWIHQSLELRIKTRSIDIIIGDFTISINIESQEKHLEFAVHLLPDQFLDSVILVFGVGQLKFLGLAETLQFLSFLVDAGVEILVDFHIRWSFGLLVLADLRILALDLVFLLLQFGSALQPLLTTCSVVCGVDFAADILWLLAEGWIEGTHLFVEVLGVLL